MYNFSLNFFYRVTVIRDPICLLPDHGHKFRCVAVVADLCILYISLFHAQFNTGRCSKTENYPGRIPRAQHTIYYINNNNNNNNNTYVPQIRLPFGRAPRARTRTIVRNRSRVREDRCLAIGILPTRIRV